MDTRTSLSPLNMRPVWMTPLAGPEVHALADAGCG